MRSWLLPLFESQALDVAPVLLIDEADAHLHLNAQADLVSLLMKQNKAAQVLYTTHSPGCLPSDLGTGIRLVEREDSTSSIESHFWTNKAPGFGSLLYAMGANAAAFSTCRRAVLAEGPSDMIMLPTLLRLATRDSRPRVPDRAGPLECTRIQHGGRGDRGSGCVPHRW